MNFGIKISKLIFRKKLILFCLISFSTAIVLAASGGGKSKGKKLSLLQKNNSLVLGKFSLKSNYVYRGGQILNNHPANTTIKLHSIVTVQKGRATFILPIKTTVYTQRIKLSAGVPQMNRN